MQGPAISLTESDANAFAILRKTNEHFELNSVMRAAGGWVRDKILGKFSDDIDIAVDNMTGEAFVNKVKEYVETVHNVKAEAEGGTGAVKLSSIGTIQANPDQSKHLATATCHFGGIEFDFANLRKETYAEDSRIPGMEFGTAEEDAYRRDFTINAMFYNLQTENVEDFTCKGLNDLQ